MGLFISALIFVVLMYFLFAKREQIFTVINAVGNKIQDVYQAIKSFVVGVVSFFRRN